MRTTSADAFINYVQNLEIDAELNTTMAGHATPIDSQYHSPRVTTPDRSSTESDQKENGSRVVMNGSSITVTEGDLLQPERIHNGIVFNVIKKGDLSPSNRSQDSYNNEVAECVQIDCPGKEMDAASSDSENGDDNSATARSPTETPDYNPADHSGTDSANDQTIVDS